MVRDVLHRGDVLSMNIEVLGHSINQNISIKLRSIFSSPSIVHLRGGSILLLKTLEKFESSLQLEPHVGASGNNYIFLRQALVTPIRISNSLNLLKSLHSMCRLFKYALEKDLHNNCFIELKEIIEKFPGLGVYVAKFTAKNDLSCSDFVTIAHRMNLLQSTKKTLLEQIDDDLSFTYAGNQASNSEVGDKVPESMKSIESHANITSVANTVKTEFIGEYMNINSINSFDVSTSVTPRLPPTPERKVQSVVNMVSFIRSKSKSSQHQLVQ
jgi:hypothetical protein